MEGSAGYREQPWRGMVVDIWLQLAATLNFTFTLGLSSDRKWGAKNQVGGLFFVGFWVSDIWCLVTIKEQIYNNVDEKTFSQTNGIWNGLVGDLVADRADVVVAPLSFTHERRYTMIMLHIILDDHVYSPTSGGIMFMLQIIPGLSCYATYNPR